MNEHKIISFTPANGEWVSCYRDEDGNTSARQVAGWALIEYAADGTRELVAMEVTEDSAALAVCPVETDGDEFVGVERVERKRP